MLESSGTESATRIVLDASPTRLASAVTVVHAFVAVKEPVIVCTPFLKESRSATVGTLGVIFCAVGLAPSRARGAERKKLMRMTDAMIAVRTRRREYFIPLEIERKRTHVSVCAYLIRVGKIDLFHYSPAFAISNGIHPVILPPPRSSPSR